MIKGRNARQHDAAHLHVQGRAPYVDDIPELEGTLHAAVSLSPVAHGKLRSLDLRAAAAAPGVVDVIDIKSIPGDANIGPVFHDEQLFAGATILYAGQALCAVAATSHTAAQRAAQLAKPSIKELKPILTIEEALARRSYVVADDRLPVIESDWDERKLRSAPHVLEGKQRCGAQEHFYLEGQVAVAQPQEDGRMLIHSSTQNPSEIQHTVAAILGVPISAVEVRVRRLGGGFGGKEVQACQPAAIAAVLAQRTGRPVKLRLPRATDFALTGKRHPFLLDYRVGFDDTGRICAADLQVASDCGCSADLSLAILDRAVYHADNAYHLPCARIRGYPCKTNKASNTAFRGFGGPQGMLLIERMIEDIARHLQLDPLDVRRRNLYTGRQQRTPYRQKVHDNILPQLLDRVERDSRYRHRRAAVQSFNAKHPHIKKGLALTPVKFGIAFTVSFLNQGGALLNVYRDGTVGCNHGGTEMGQGLFIKIAQVVSKALGVKVERVSCEATTTAKVPNTSATAASAGTDLNGKAAEAAAQAIRGRLAQLAAELSGDHADEIEFRDDMVIAPSRSWRFPELVERAYLERLSLAATGFYRVPNKVDFDPVTRIGRPFFYYTYGAAVSEVAVDVLTGEYRLLQVDILHDVGTSLNPAVDIGQIEGGFAQGLGWLTCEELAWDDAGRIQAHGPATYKIPAASDLPERFTVRLWPEPNREHTIGLSKAVGEPPLMLAISAWAALADAVAHARGDDGSVVRLDAPATPERVLLAINNKEAPARRAQAKQGKAAKVAQA